MSHMCVLIQNYTKWEQKVNKIKVNEILMV